MKEKKIKLIHVITEQSRISFGETVKKCLIAGDYSTATAINTFKGVISRQFPVGQLTITPNVPNNHHKFSCDMIICTTALRLNKRTHK